MVGDKEKIQEFLALQNKDGLKALDYCVFKNRHDMAAILREFVETSQHVVNIKAYTIEKQPYPTCPAEIESHPTFKKLSETFPSQYSSRGLVLDFFKK